MFENIFKHKTLIIVVLTFVLIGGLVAYVNMGKLEDAEIPIKSAIVYTIYPGATAHEVELEVTDVLEKAIERLEFIEDIESFSTPGFSYIMVNILPTVKTKDLPQLWDHLRRKINDSLHQLPKSAFKPVINDDFSDVYGMFFAVTADGYSYKELNDYVDYVKKELVDIPGIRRAQIYGKQVETVEVLFASEDLANLSVNPMLIANTIQDHSKIVNPGQFSIDDESIRFGIGSKINSCTELEDLLIQVPGGGNFRLGDIATIQKSFQEPRKESLTFNGNLAISIGLSNETGVNIVELGEKVRKRINELNDELPVGVKVQDIYFQPDRVRFAVKDFMLNLILSVGIVIVVLLFSMGIRSGLLIASGLVFTILATLLIMFGINLPLHRVTLAAIIIAMGMLVDNSIVVGDGILLNIKRGFRSKDAFLKPAQRTAVPLLGATLVAILAFWPLKMAPSRAGEFMSSLFTVLSVSLLLSWLFAMIQTPFMAEYFFKSYKPSSNSIDPYNKGIYPLYKISIEWVLKYRFLFIAICFVLLVVTLSGFRNVRKDFFPKINYNHFVVEYIDKNGCDIESVNKNLVQISRHLRDNEKVTAVTTAIRRPPARYSLMRPMSKGGDNYGELIIETQTPEDVNTVYEYLKQFTDKKFPDALFRFKMYGPSFNDFDIEVEFTGPDPAVLRQLTNQAKKIMTRNPNAVNVCDNWKNRTKVITPNYSVEKAQKVGLSRIDMANSILMATTGLTVGKINEGLDEFFVLLRLKDSVEKDLNKMPTLPIWGKRTVASTPLNQIVDTTELEWEEERIFRYNGKRTMKAQCDPIYGVLPSELQMEIKDEIDAIVIPEGYKRRWDGTVGSSAEARGALFKFLPLALALMLIIIIALFNNIKQPLIIFCIVPFAMLGVVIGFLLTGKSFTFIGIIGALGLIGMMIKNAVVLLDEINIGINEGKSAYNATVDASMSRMRPVMMASITTILGMFPLLRDIMFNSLAITIMFGLIFGSLITLYVVPALYALLYKIKKNNNGDLTIVNDDRTIC